MRRLGPVALAAVLIPFGAPPALAVSQSVDMENFDFSPVVTNVLFQGIPVHWNNGTIYTTHTSTANGPFELWDTGDVLPGTLSRDVYMNYAGTFNYHCIYHPTQMQGRVRVPLEVVPTSGNPATTFDIHPAQIPAPTGLAYEVWARRGSGDWERIFRGTDDEFTDQFQRGMWKLRGRMTKGPRRNRKFSGWSPQVPLPIT